MNAESVKSAVQALSWYHQIDLGDGIVTPGVDDSAYRLQRLELPATLRDKTVLDIGAWDGFFSFEAERRGARRVVATDSYSWHGDGWGTKRGFELARRVLNSHVEDVDIDVFELSPERVGQFDLVFFLGVLYHVKHPLLALERVASVTRECLIMETVVDMIGITRPAWAFYGRSELNRDPTNWWAPNIAGAIEALRAVGFKRVIVRTPTHAAPYRAARAVYHAMKGKNTLGMAYRQDRAVFHAFKD